MDKAGQGKTVSGRAALVFKVDIATAEQIKTRKNKVMLPSGGTIFHIYFGDVVVAGEHLRRQRRAIGIDCGPTRAPLAPRVGGAEEKMKELVFRPSIKEWLV